MHNSFSSDEDSVQKEIIMETSPKGRYVRYSDELGKGSYKIVYRGLDQYEMKEIAWNVISVKNLSKKEKERILSEIKILHELKHENIIKILATWYNKEKQEVIFITDIISGGSLRDFLYKHYNSSNRVKLCHILNWSKQIISVLKYLHEKKIVHRDIKCDNIFIDSESSKIYLGDFGLATIKQINKMDSIVGTVAYMAPEMYEDDYDEKVDIYAFGICLIEMITTEVPYSECHTVAQIYKKTINSIYPEALKNIEDNKMKELILYILSKKELRPSAEHLYNILDKYIT